MHIITNGVNSNSVHDGVCSIQHFVIKFVSDLRRFSPGTPVSSTSKTDCHDITDILLRAGLNTIIHKPTHLRFELNV